MANRQQQAFREVAPQGCSILLRKQAASGGDPRSFVFGLWVARPASLFTFLVFVFLLSVVTAASAAPVNLALNQPTVASSQEKTTLAPQFAVDGKTTTRWASAAAIDPQWIYVDLGTAKSINRVVLNWETAYGKAYQIQVSNDALNWTTVFSESNGNGGIDDISFTTTSARYVRMYGTVRGTQWGYSLYEFEVYEDTGPPVLTSIDVTPASASVVTGATQQFTATGRDQNGATLATTVNWTVSGGGSIDSNGLFTANTVGGPFTVTATATSNASVSGSATVSVTDGSVAPPGNLALGQPVVASSQEKSTLAPQFAVDGNASSRWASVAAIDPQWIYVDVGAVYPLNRVVLNWETAYGKAYEIQVSSDASTWTTVFSESNGNGGIDDISFATTDARYVRVFGTVRGTQWGYSLYEFEVYGDTGTPVLTTIDVSPASASVVTGGTQQFTATGRDQNGATLATTVNWAVSGGGSIDGNGLFTASAAGGPFTVTATATSNASISGSATVTVTNPTSSPNLALNQPTVASSQEKTTLAPQFAVDGKTTTRWASAAAIDPQWIYVDLGTAKSINRVVLNWETAYGKAYQIQVSNDALNWTTVFSESNGNGGIDDISFTTTSARYVRVYGTVRGTQWGYSLYEFEVYGDTGTPVLTTIDVSPASASVVTGGTQQFTATGRDQNGATLATTVNWAVSGGGSIDGNGLFTASTAGGPFTVTATATSNASISGSATVDVTASPAPTSDLAVGKTASASSQETAQLAPANAVDGDSNTRWSSALGVDPQWISVDLGAVYSIDHVVLNWETAYGKAYQIQVSTDALNWTTAFSESNGDGGIDNISFPVTNARYVRMYGTVRGTKWGYSLWDFQVFASPTLPVSYDFSTADLSAWVTVDDSQTASSWQVVGGAYQQANDVGDQSLGTPFVGSYKLGTFSYLPALGGLSDYRLSVDITPLRDVAARDPFDGQDVGVMFRYQDENNYYRVSFSARESFARLEKRVGGVFTTLATDARGYLEEQTFNLSVNISGGLVQVTRDGDPLFAVYDTDLANGTVALYCQDKASFDNVLVDVNDPNPTLVLSHPLAYSVQTNNTVGASAAVTNLPASGSVDFQLGGAACGPASESPAGSGFFTASCGTPAQGDYYLSGMGLVGQLRNSSGGVVASDENTRVGIQGDQYVTVGDSITLGTFDFYSLDNQSSDGRVIGQQGYQARLTDLLTAARGYPNIVYNEGVGGDRTTDTLTRIDSILERHSGANIFLMMLGTNDSAGSTPLTQTAYQNNMQSLVNKIAAQGKTVWVAKVPPVLPFSANATRNSDLQGYNTAIDGLSGVQHGPDFFNFFYDNGGTPGVSSDDYERLSLYHDKLHGNSLANRIMAVLWNNALTGSTTVPFYLDRLCNRLVSAGCASVSPTNHKQNLLQTGYPYYIDQSFTLTSIPAVLADGIWIQTANSERNNTASSYIDFNVDRPVTVYVAYDAAAAALPDWLNPATSAYVDTGLNIQTSNPAAPTLRVYSRSFAAGSVGLGANMATGASGANANYVVVVTQ